MIVAKGFLLGIVLGAALLALCLLSIIFPTLALVAIAIVGVALWFWLLARPTAALLSLEDNLPSLGTAQQQEVGAMLLGAIIVALLAGWWIGSTLTRLNQLLSP